MRLTIIGINFAPEVTGVAPYTTAMAAGLARRGHVVTVITGLPHYPQWRVDRAHSRDFTTDDGVTVHRVRHPVPRTPRVLGRLRMEVGFAIGAVCAKWGRPDVVIAVSPALVAAAAVTARARFSRIPVGIVVQDVYSAGAAEVWSLSGPVDSALRALEQRTLSGADGLVVIHDRFVDTLIGAGVDTRSVSVVRNWNHVSVDAAHGRETTRSARGWSRDDVVVVHAGNMGRKQALDTVVEAARLADQRSSCVRFVLVGDGNQRRSLQRLAGVVERIEFIPTVPEREFTALLAAADVLLVNEMPTVTEMVLPSKITSYLAVGRPIVAATPIGSVTADEVRASRAGIVIPPGDPAALLDTVLAAGRNESLIRDAALSGPEHARQILGATEAIDAYEAWSQSLARRAGSQSSRTSPCDAPDCSGER